MVGFAVTVHLFIDDGYELLDTRECGADFCEIGYLCVKLNGRSALSTCEREDTETISEKAEIRVSKQSELAEFRDQLEGFRTRAAPSLL